MTYPTLSKDQQRDLKRFMIYLAESDASWIMEYGAVFPTFQRDREAIRDVAHINLYNNKQRSGLNVKTAGEFARSLGTSIMATTQAAYEAPGKYDWLIVDEIAKLNRLGWQIMYYNSAM